MGVSTKAALNFLDTLLDLMRQAAFQIAVSFLQFALALKADCVEQLLMCKMVSMVN